MFFKRSALILLTFLFSCFRTEPAFLHMECLVTIDGNPVDASVEVNSLQNNTSYTVNADGTKTEGNFTTQLPAGDEYEIVVKVDRFPQQVINLSTLKMDASKVLNVFADFTSPEYDKKLEELIKSNEEFLSKISSFDKKNFSQRFGNIKKETLEYKVQIGAYKFYENFNYNNVLGFPKIIRKVENDQITRFTMGGFETYNQAAILLEKLQKNNVKDAFIIASYNGERKMLQQLVEEKILD